MLRTGGICRDEREANGSFHGARKLDFRFLRGFDQPLQRLAVFSQIDTLIALVLLRYPVDDPLVEIVTAEMGIPGSGTNLEDSVADIEERNIERAAAEVEHQNCFIFFLIQAISQSGGR